MGKGKKIAFGAKVWLSGASLVVTIPSSNCHYAGILAGDIVEVAIETTGRTAKKGRL